MFKISKNSSFKKWVKKPIFNSNLNWDYNEIEILIFENQCIIYKIKKVTLIQ